MAKIKYAFHFRLYLGETPLMILGVMLLMDTVWGRSREVGCSTALAKTQLPAARSHIATTSCCSFEGSPGIHFPDV